MEKKKIIIDTDPGVDDNFALLYALYNEEFDVKLITISNGNVGIEKSTRNTLHLLDLLNKDIPVVAGYSQRFGENDEVAFFLHGDEGLGMYYPPMETERKAIEVDCSDKMYEVIMQDPNEITLVVLGPHTNVAHLFRKYPDVKNYIKEIVMMGGAPGGVLINKEHVSFNIRTDAPAFQTTIDSGLPIVMCPSKIGRDVLYLSEEQYLNIKNSGVMGKFVAKTFDTYWEIGYPDKRISTCDISSLYYISRPDLFTTVKCDIVLDQELIVGKTTAVYNENGQFTLITDANREEIHKLFMEIYSS